MGEDYKAKIEVVLNNEDHVDMCLNGETTTLQNLAIGVMAQTIALGTDSWDDAKLQLAEVTFALPLALEEAWKNKEADDMSPSRKNGQEKCEKSRMKQTGANESKVKRQKLHTAAFQNRRAISIQSKSEDELCCRKLQYKQRYRSVPPAWSDSGADEPAHISDS